MLGQRVVYDNITFNESKLGLLNLDNVFVGDCDARFETFGLWEVAKQKKKGKTEDQTFFTSKYNKVCAVTHPHRLLLWFHTPPTCLCLPRARVFPCWQSAESRSCLKGRRKLSTSSLLWGKTALDHIFGSCLNDFLHCFPHHRASPSTSTAATLSACC